MPCPSSSGDGCRGDPPQRERRPDHLGLRAADAGCLLRGKSTNGEIDLGQQVATTDPSTPTTTVPAEPGWTPISVGPSGVIIDERDVADPDGRRITVVRYRAGQVQFNLHIGSRDPPAGAAVLGPQSSSSVSTAELPDLLAVFNGGFEANASAGGVEVGGQILTPLVDGFASFVIDTDGTGRVGVWDSTVPVPGEQVASVRQNLPPLIENGQISPVIGDIAQWGDVLHGVAATARSALGEDAQGDILYAAATSALPLDLATALSEDGASVGMELDINPEWIQLDVASEAGGPLQAVVRVSHVRPTSTSSGGPVISSQCSPRLSPWSWARAPVEADRIGVIWASWFCQVHSL